MNPVHHRPGMDALAEKLCTHLSDLAEHMARETAFDLTRPFVEETIEKEKNADHKRELEQQLAKDMKKAASYPPVYKDLQEELLSLKPEKFQVLYAIHNMNLDIFRQIERAVNENTNDQVKAREGQFSFDDEYADMFDPDMISLVTFNPETCTNSRERYAALMVVQRFGSMLESVPGKRPGRLKPAGAHVGLYGCFSTYNFDALAYWFNGALSEKYAFPETLSHVDFSAYGEKSPFQRFRQGPKIS